MIIQADALNMPLEDCSVDAVVTDPPYGLEFMGKEWDRLESGFGRIDNKNMNLPNNLGNKRNVKCPDCEKWIYDHHPRECQCGGVYRLKQRRMQAWHQEWLTEAYRVLKPGGSMLVMGGTRTFHRLMCAMEDAGFIIKDTLMWIYGSGFPKAQDLSAMIDKRMGAERNPITNEVEIKDLFRDEKAEVIAEGQGAGTRGNTFPLEHTYPITESLTDLAKHWDGFKIGGIKPAYEPIVWAVKPPEGSYVDNVLKWGVGAVNVDECRIGYINGKTPDMEQHKYPGKGKSHNAYFGNFKQKLQNLSHSKGRFPANVILDEESARIMDEMSGERKTPDSYKVGKQADGNIQFNQKPIGFEKVGYGDNGGASRFFYCAKASRRERNAGLDDVLIDGERQEGEEEKPVHWSSGDKNPGSFQSDGTNKQMKNNHPTVKPIALFEWLIKLVTREGQTVLDPFLGSGTTAISAHNTGRKCIGIEKEGGYVEIARRRQAYWQAQPRQMELT